MAEIATVAAIASIAATGISVASNLYAGQKQQDAAYALALQEEARGDAEFAASQRAAEERKLEAKLIMSRQQAVAAASGGGADEDAPTIVKIMSDTVKRAEYGRESELYRGAATRKNYYESAAARRRGGDNSFLGSIFSAGGSLASGIGSFAELRA
jgi:hypothetical protein